MTTSSAKKLLPGDIYAREKTERMVRVNHAGEYGAKRIYEGQLSVLKGHKEIEHMAEQEEQHLAYFSEQIAERQLRPTALLPVWHVLGFALGAGTALLGEKAAMACTVAVEEVIDEHYQEQIDLLDEDDADLKSKIEQFREEELEHRDTGIEHGAYEATAYPVLSTAIKGASKLAIWLSTRV